MKTRKQLERIAEINQDLLARVRWNLATEFDVPARDIIAKACQQLDITREEFSDLPPDPRGAQ